ncbi:histidine phosphatase family protein [Qaidamihabitans albus]|uniref:histidine phosphatase family protein n=1 Tax=Qaidamihabitans albus TaxID=2795733 RepID=UPI0018F24080|nr:histidine phosphatase family protein [Qaidamihabitans albus]
MPTRLLLVRHGETEWHAENRYAGSSEVGLTERGLRQAHELAAVLETMPGPPAALYCSPQERARITAEPSARALGLTPTVLPDLREVHFGIAEGRTLDEVRGTDPDAVRRFLADPVAGAFPGAEPPAAAADRAAAALRSIAGNEAGPVLVVAHNTLLRLTLCLLLGIPLHTYRTVFPRLENCALTEIGIDGERTSLRRLNAPTPG